VSKIVRVRPKGKSVLPSNTPHVIIDNAEPIFRGLDLEHVLTQIAAGIGAEFKSVELPLLVSQAFVCSHHFNTPLPTCCAQGHGGEIAEKNCSITIRRCADAIRGALICFTARWRNQSELWVSCLKPPILFTRARSRPESGLN